MTSMVQPAVIPRALWASSLQVHVQFTIGKHADGSPDKEPAGTGSSFAPSQNQPPPLGGNLSESQLQALASLPIAVESRTTRPARGVMAVEAVLLDQ
jgi:hypothetical protein